MAWILAILAAVALVALAAVGGRKAINRERERLLLQQRHSNEREAARRILTGPVAPLPDTAVNLPAGEQAYFQAAASHLVPVNEDEDEFERRSRGTMVITDQALVYVAMDGRQTRLGMDSIGRIDLPLADILTVVTFTETFARDEVFWYFQLEQPLVAAAHLSRFAGFQLVLSGDTMPDLGGHGLPGDDQPTMDAGQMDARQGEKFW